MDIGKEERTIRLPGPTRAPVPQRERTSPGRERKPRRFEPIEPTAPVEEPDKQPVKVPSK